MTVRQFEHHTDGIDWYCEQRGDGPPIVLVPSGEGDCSSFEKVAAALADQFTVLTFDMPGFSRSTVRSPDFVSAPLLADQIAELVRSLGCHPATFYGCSSGGMAVLDLVVRHGALVQKAIVHEVADTRATTLLGDLASQDDPTIVETCRYLFAYVMNDDAAAWEALGDEFHARLATNYVTWVRRYVAPGVLVEHSSADLAGKPITWTIGGLSPAGSFLDNVVLATQAGLCVDALMCKHFPQVSAPDMLAQHVRTNAAVTA
ncbi:MAG: alpha/beta fold hydrolase [Mycobacterium sp.]